MENLADPTMPNIDPLAKRKKFIRSKKDWLMLGIMFCVLLMLIYVAFHAHALSTDPCRYCMEEFNMMCHPLKLFY
jgi:hypothetical protein